MLAQKAKEARAKADETGDPVDEAYADALEAAEAAEARDLIEQLRDKPDRDTTGIRSPAEAGHVSEMKIPPGAAGN